jgi:hypothetical protein
MLDAIKYNTMEVLESAAYIALGFIPTLGLLEIAYRLGMKIRRKMDKANVSIRKYFSKQTITGISSHIAAKKLIFRHHKLRLNFSIQRMMNELLAYNGTFGTTLYSVAGLEMYFYCNYRDEFE